MIVLDTHILLWWVSSSNKLSTLATQKLTQLIQDKGTVLVSSISIWEIAVLIEKGRLSLKHDLAAWLEVLMSIDYLKFVPVDNEIAVKSVQLPEGFHKDPADRIIVATARHYGVPLITADQKINDYQHVKTIW